MTMLARCGLFRCGSAMIGLAIGLMCGVAARAQDESDAAPLPKGAIESLLTQLDKVNHDPDMTTAKRALMSTEEMEKFNKKYLGKSLTVRLKIRDVVPSPQGQFLTAGNPNLDVLQLPTTRFQVKLSNEEVLAINKESTLALSGVVSGAMQSQVRYGFSLNGIAQGGTVSFSLKSNPACRINLDRITYHVEAPGSVKPEAASPGASVVENSPVSTSGTTGAASDSRFPGLSAHKKPTADKTKNEQTRSVDDIKAFFLKGIQPPNTPTTSTGSPSPIVSNSRYGYNTRPGLSNNAYGQANGAGTTTTAKPKKNRIYTAGEIMQKFGEPTSRASASPTETWTYKCKDGTVKLHFTEVGYASSGSQTMTERLRLEIKSVDSSSGGPGFR